MGIRTLLLVLSCACLVSMAYAQDEENEARKGFQKEKLFTGGSIQVSFSNYSFLIGGSPVFGYSVTNWADLGVVVNYIYTSYRDVSYVDDKLRQTVFGGGPFVRLFPVRFLFAQAQFEHNWTRSKYIYPPNISNSSEVNYVSSNSFLIGAGYTTGRDPEGGSSYGYLAILFDVMKDQYSPYTDNLGRSLPVIRAGIHIPLFQGR